MNKYRVGFFVTMDVEAADRGDAIHVAQGAADFPGDMTYMARPRIVSGKVNGIDVTATILNSKCLTVVPLRPNGDVIDPAYPDYSNEVVPEDEDEGDYSE